MRLLVTRPEPEAATQAEELRRFGHEPVLQPLLEFGALDFDPAPLRLADALIFTSANAVRALQQKIDPQDIAATPVFCVGGKTARRAGAAGFQSVAAIADTAEELSAKIVSQAPKGAILVHVTGEHQAFDLAHALEREGLSLHTLRVYSMKARDAFESQAAEALQAGAIGGVILMSPRTAEIFVSLCRHHDLLDSVKGLRYFCLAASVAKKLMPLQPVSVHIAAKPGRDALLALLEVLPTPGHDPFKNQR